VAIVVVGTLVEDHFDCLGRIDPVMNQLEDNFWHRQGFEGVIVGYNFIAVGVGGDNFESVGKAEGSKPGNFYRVVCLGGSGKVVDLRSVKRGLSKMHDRGRDRGRAERCPQSQGVTLETATSNRGRLQGNEE